MWTKVLRSKLEHDKSRGKRRTESSKRDAEGDTQSASSTDTDYIPPWFGRYVEYKFNLLDRTGQISQTYVYRCK